MTRHELGKGQALGKASLVAAGLAALLVVGGSPVGAPRAYAGAGYIFTTVGESQFQVPNGIYGITVTLDAGSGGNGKHTGGAGAEVTAMVGVNPNSTVYVEVGGNGGNGNGVKAYNGGGAGSYSAGGGGGASDIRTCAAASCPLTGDVSTDPRLLVAGGGGGGGGEINTSDGGSGGNADYDSTNAPGNGGNGGTCANGNDQGAGGAGATGSAAGGNGSAGQGGDGYFYKSADMSVGAGAGGGGWFGGGGGSLNQTLQGPYCGGGAGSSYATSLAFNVDYGVNTSGSPSVTISYGTPTIVPYAHLKMHVTHGWTTLHWVSVVPVAGYNVYAGRARLNTHLVVGHGHRYNFTIHRVIRDVHLMPVPLR